MNKKHLLKGPVGSRMKASVHHLILWVLVLTGNSCERKEAPSVNKGPRATAIEYLRQRNYGITEAENGLSLTIEEIVAEDVPLINALRDLIEIRVVAFGGIPPDVFEQFQLFPRVREVVICYKMPAASIALLDDKFINVEILRFWDEEDVCCEALPPLPKLRLLENASSLVAPLSHESVRRIAACKNLEEVVLHRPVSEEGMRFLFNLPKLRKIENFDVEVFSRDK